MQTEYETFNFNLDDTFDKDDYIGIVEAVGTNYLLVYYDRTILGASVGRYYFWVDINNVYKNQNENIKFILFHFA